MDLPFNSSEIGAITFHGIEESLIAGVILLIATGIISAIGRWWWIAGAKERGMKGYFVGISKVVCLFPPEREFPRAFDVCYHVKYSRIPRRFKIISYSRIKDLDGGLSVDICRGGWRERDYLSLEYSKQERLISSFGRSTLKFTVTNYVKSLNGAATGVSKGLFEGKDVIYAADLHLTYSAKMPEWVRSYLVASKHED